MKTTNRENSLDLFLEFDDSFYFKGAALRSFPHVNWQAPPRFPSGSPIARLLHGWYFLRRVDGTTAGLNVPMSGMHPRGNFHPLFLKEGQKMYISAHSVVGFSGQIKSIKTHIHFWPSFWLLRKWFFTVFTGPGMVLVYSRSPVTDTEESVFQSDQIIAFDAHRQFRCTAPRPSEMVSHILNIFSTEVAWTFLDRGTTVAEKHVEGDESDEEGNFIWRTIKHIIGFLHF